VFVVFVFCCFVLCRYSIFCRPLLLLFGCLQLPFIYLFICLFVCLFVVGVCFCCRLLQIVVVVVVVL